MEINFKNIDIERVGYGLRNVLTRGGRRTEQIFIDKQYGSFIAGELIENTMRSTSVPGMVFGLKLDSDRFIQGYNQKRMNTAYGQ